MAILLALTILFAPDPAGANSNTLNYRLKWLLNTSVVGDLYAWDQ